METVFVVEWVAPGERDTVAIAKTIQGARNATLRFIDDFTFEVREIIENPEELILEKYVLDHGRITIVERDLEY